MIEEIYKEFHVPRHIIGHMKAVAEVCKILADKLIEAGEKIDKQTLVKAALLHDVLRICDFREFDEQNFPYKPSREDISFWLKLRKKYGELGHEKAIAQILEARGEHKTANLIVKHDFLKIDELESWEEKILYYADKRVDKDKIVKLKERFREGAKRNRKKEDDPGKIKTFEKKVYKLEEEFRKVLGESIYDL